MADVLSLDAAQAAYRDELADAGLLIRTGVPGVYGLGGVFEGVVDRLDAFVLREVGPLAAEVMRFPPVISRANSARTDHLESFPNMTGSVHSFTGDDKAHQDLIRPKQGGEDRACCLQPTD